MTFGAWLFVALPLLGLPHTVGTLDVADTTTTYLRGASKSVDPALDLDTMPEVMGTLSFRRAQMRVDYAPRLTLRDVADDRAFIALHNAAASFGYQTPRFSLGVSQTLTIGRQYFSNLGLSGVPASLTDPAAGAANTTAGTAVDTTAVVTDPSVQLLPSVRDLKVRSQQTIGTLSYLWTRRWYSELRGSYLIAGGRSEVAQLIQPRRREGNVAAGVGFVLTPRQRLTTVATLSRVLISNGFEHWLTGVGEDWSMQWTRRTRSNLNVGGIWRRSLRPDGSEKTSVVPDAMAALSYEATRGTYNLTLDANGALSPLINTLTGELQVAGRGQLAGNLRYHKTLGTLTVDAYQTLPTDRPLATRLIGGGLVVGQLLTTWLSIGGAARLQHQRLEGSPLSLPLQWALSASLRAQIRTLRF